MKVSFDQAESDPLPLSFSPLEVTMIIDNILDNAARANAKELRIKAKSDENYMDLLFMNNGNPLTSEYRHKDLFTYGVTVTGGSGIGLAQVRRVSNNLEASASIYETPKGKVVVRLRWEK